LTRLALAGLATTSIHAQDFDGQLISPAQFDNIDFLSGDKGDPSNGKIGKIMNEIMTCSVDTLKNNGIDRDSGNLMNYLSSEEWINTVEYGTKREFIDNLGDAVDPITS